MSCIIDKFISQCIKNEIITPDQVAWLRYGLELRLSTFLVLVPFLALAWYLVGFSTAVLFFVCFFYLKRFTGGYHANSKYKCLIISILLELIFLLGLFPKLNYLMDILVNVLSIWTVFIFAPYNHPNIHLTYSERIALQLGARRTVFLLVVGSIMLSQIGCQKLANGATAGTAMASFLLCLAYIIDWRKSK